MSTFYDSKLHANLFCFEIYRCQSSDQERFRKDKKDYYDYDGGDCYPCYCQYHSKNCFQHQQTPILWLNNQKFHEWKLEWIFNILLISISISKQNTCTFKVNINKVKIILIWRKADKRNNCGKFKIKKLLTLHYRKTLIFLDCWMHNKW